MQEIVHYSLHLIAPAGVAWLLFRNDWKKAYLLILATMLVDIDHLLASPIFDPHRCSIGHHPLHSIWAMMVYALLLLAPKPWRILAVGLLLHMLTDFIDCWWMMRTCDKCSIDPLMRDFMEWLNTFGPQPN